MQLRRSLVALLLVVGACAGGTSSTTTVPSPSMSSTTVRSTTVSTIVHATAVPTTTTTTVALPDEPRVSAGWSLQAGDLLVANGGGVHVVRGGVTVANPVTSPVESAFADGSGGIVLLTPDPDRYPEYWPDPYSGGARIVWRVTPDGNAEAIYTSEAPEGVTWGTLNIYEVSVVVPVSEAPSVIFTRREPFSNDPYSWHWDRIWVLPLDPDATPTLIPAETPGEGGVSGIGWQQLGNRLLMATEK